MTYQLIHARELMNHRCRESSDPRRKGFCACGRKISYGMRERDIGLERRLTDTAARAAGLPGSQGLDEFADARALPGGVRANMDYDQEVREEIADARNYLVWGIEPLYADLRSGQFVDDYERRMRCLTKLVESWAELGRRSA